MLMFIFIMILFISDLSLSDFPILPKYLMMGYETFANRTYGNDGITLFNIQGMRRTYNEFIQLAFSEKWIENGLYYGEMGNLDQGSFNLMYCNSNSISCHYKKDIISPIIFNWRPYWPVPKHHKSAIIHFHGPKPIDYIQYFDNPDKALMLFKPIFKRCENPHVECQFWAGIWVDMLNKIHDGFLPTFKLISS